MPQLMMPASCQRPSLPCIRSGQKEVVMTHSRLEASLIAKRCMLTLTTIGPPLSPSQLSWPPEVVPAHTKIFGIHSFCPEFLNSTELNWSSSSYRLKFRDKESFFGVIVPTFMWKEPWEFVVTFVLKVQRDQYQFQHRCCQFCQLFPTLKMWSVGQWEPKVNHCSPVHPHALAIGDDRELDFSENRRDLPILREPTPASHCSYLENNQKL